MRGGLRLAELDINYLFKKNLAEALTLKGADLRRNALEGELIHSEALTERSPSQEGEGDTT
jgi:hypothetical protein